MTTIQSQEMVARSKTIERAESMLRIAELYAKRKGGHGGARRAGRSAGRASERVASELGTSRSFVERSARFAQQFDEINLLARDLLLRERLGVTRRDVAVLHRLPPLKQLGIVAHVTHGHFRSLRVALRELASSEDEPDQDADQCIGSNDE